MNDPIIEKLYGTAAGRFFMKLGIQLGVPKLIAGYLRSPISKHRIPRYIRKNGISMEEFPQEHYPSFAAFFARQKSRSYADMEASHLISPCDGLLSVYSVQPDSSFSIKGTRYTLNMLLQDPTHKEEYCGGLCLLFRLTATDYHHYIFVDDGTIGKTHFIEGQLHSVQPAACQVFPVYRLNRRKWNLLDTVNFGPIIQVEVGAVAVGGIVIEQENCRISRGSEMGHFELCGSTIVLLLQKGRADLLPEYAELMDSEKEHRVRLGCCIGKIPAATDSFCI